MQESIEPNPEQVDPDSAYYSKFAKLALQDKGLRHIDILIGGLLVAQTTTLMKEGDSSEIACAPARSGHRFETAYSSKSLLKKEDYENFLQVFDHAVQIIAKSKRNVPSHLDASALETEVVRKDHARIYSAIFGHILDIHPERDVNAIEKLKPDYFPAEEFRELIQQIRVLGNSDVARETLLTALKERKPLTKSDYEKSARSLKNDFEFLDDELAILQAGRNCLVEMAKVAGYDIKGRTHPPGG